MKGKFKPGLLLRLKVIRREWRDSIMLAASLPMCPMLVSENCDRASKEELAGGHSGG